jgi:hypothetical protein
VLQAVISVHAEAGDAAQRLSGTLDQTPHSHAGEAAKIVSNVLDAVPER